MKQQQATIGVAALLLAIAGTSSAEVTGNVTVVSDYLFDGVSQTDNGPALQAGVEWAHDAGLYAGLWGSNVDFGAGSDSNLELDLYIGYGWGDETVAFDVGYVRYLYLDGLSTADDDIDYDEVYAGVTFNDNTNLTAWYAADYGNTGDSAWRAKLSHAFAVSEDWSVPVELTHSAFEDDDINHFRVGIATTMAELDVDLSYHRTDADENVYDEDVYSTDGNFVLTVAKGF